MDDSSTTTTRRVRPRLPISVRMHIYKNLDFRQLLLSCFLNKRDAKQWVLKSEILDNEGEIQVGFETKSDDVITKIQVLGTDVFS